MADDVDKEGEQGEQQQQLGQRALKELEEVFDDLVTLLKNPEVGATLTARGVNTSLAIVGAEGLAAYIHGDKKRAADDLGTVAEEITARLALAAAENVTMTTSATSAKSGDGEKPS